MTSPEKVSTSEKYNIYLETNRDTQINDKNTSEKQDLRHFNTLRIR